MSDIGLVVQLAASIAAQAVEVPPALAVADSVARLVLPGFDWPNALASVVPRPGTDCSADVIAAEPMLAFFGLSPVVAVTAARFCALPATLMAPTAPVAVEW
jgi:hypothetical protein